MDETSPLSYYSFTSSLIDEIENERAGDVARIAIDDGESGSVLSFD